MGSIGDSNFFQQNEGLDYDVLIIGAGLSGIYSLYKMHELGMRVKLLEAGSGEGGTWFWNRYPGCRFDSESVSYGFSFSQSLLDEWSWTETFAPGHETLRYAQYITDKFDLRKDMQFDTRVTEAKYRQCSRSWRLKDHIGRSYTSRYLITALGILNEPTYPNIEGVSSFKGESFHTSRWPKEYSLKNKRVGIIGTGATGIQIIQEIVKEVGHLTVFQRTPNWSAPLRNEKISPEKMEDIRKRYPEIFKKCAESWSCFVHMPEDTRKTLDVPEAERLAFWEDLYARPGFAKWFSNYPNINTEKAANDAFSKFIADKIRERVKDPVTAEKLIPKDHGFGTRRVPLETFYFEAYNQDNVRLIDVSDNKIERITETGIQTRDEHVDLDVIIYATGFDALTGAFNKIDFRGIDNVKLTDAWAGGIKTFLGLFIPSFPNMQMIMGPHQMFGNIPRSIEYAVGWVARFIEYCVVNDITYAECTEEKAQEWTQHVHDCAKGLLMNEVDSWMTGVNKNVAGKQKRIVARYNGPAPGYRRQCEDVAERGYKDLMLG